jgi:hypothetical protein
MAERQMTGKQEVSEHVEMAGWGVEEAQARNKKDASKLTLILFTLRLHVCNHNNKHFLIAR